MNDTIMQYNKNMLQFHINVTVWSSRVKLYYNPATGCYMIINNFSLFYDFIDLSDQYCDTEY